MKELLFGLLLAGVGAQEPGAPAAPDPEQGFTERLVAWLEARAKPDPDVAALRASRRALAAQARVLGIDAYLRDSVRLRQLFDPALVGATQALEDPQRQTGILDAWHWLSAELSVSAQQNGYRVIVRVVADSDALGNVDPRLEGLLAPWPDLSLLPDTAIVALRLPREFGFQDEFWGDTKAGRAREAQRVAAFEAALRDALRAVPRFDPNKLVLDCDRNTCGFGLRLLTYWPRRFAGALLRDPEVVPGLRLDAVATPVGLLVEFLTRESHEEVQARLDEAYAQQGRAPRHVVASFESFEHRIAESDQPAYDRWVLGLERQSDPPQSLVLAPNGLAGHGMDWLTIEAFDESVGSVRDARIEARIDRARNRVTVQSRRVREVTFWLDDRLLDLSEPITFVLDGSPVVEYLVRDVWCACERARRTGDPFGLATVRITLALPKRD